ncbi:hypothetical protein PSYJA_45091, partial [Pseudomonas syringae pv. japonica str. M301072]
EARLSVIYVMQFTGGLGHHRSLRRAQEALLVFLRAAGR